MASDTTKQGAYGSFISQADHGSISAVGDRITIISGTGERVPFQRPRRAENFTGRDAELRELLNELQPCKMVALCGPGGIGKSALAIEALWRLTPKNEPPQQFPDGIIFYSFYGRPDMDHAFEHIVRSFDEKSSDISSDAAFRLLSAKQALLLLDGTEEASDLPLLLQITGSCGVLITSRTRDDAGACRSDLSTLIRGDAVKLLKKWGNKYVDDDTTAGRICDLIGGLPLAVRLSGQYIKSNRESAAQYLKWLQQSPLEALHHGRRKQKSVPILLERSLENVNPTALEVLAVTGVLSFSPFERETIAAALPETNVKPALGGLVRIGLLLKTGNIYTVSHALIHTYVKSHIPSSSGIDKRLALHYEVFSREQQKQGVEGYARLDLARGHIMRVLSLCNEHQNWHEAMALTEAIDHYLNYCGYWAERQTANETALKASKCLKDRKSESLFLNRKGLIYRDRGDPERAEEFYLKSLEIEKSLKRKAGMASVYGNLGNLYRVRGDLDKAEESHFKSLEIEKALDRQKGIASDYGNLGNIYQMRGDLSKAEKFYLKSLEIEKSLGHQEGMASVYGNLGNIYQIFGDLDKAEGFLLKSLEINKALGRKEGMAIQYGNLGENYQGRGDLDKAEGFLLKSLEINKALGRKEGMAIQYGNLGENYQGRGELKKAEEFYHKSLEIEKTLGRKEGIASQNCNLGNLYQIRGDIDKACDYWQKSFKLFEDIGAADKIDLVGSLIDENCIHIIVYGKGEI